MTRERQEGFIELREITSAFEELDILIANFWRAQPDTKYNQYIQIVRLLADARKHARQVKNLSQKIERFRKFKRNKFPNIMPGTPNDVTKSVLDVMIVKEKDFDKGLGVVIKIVENAQQLNDRSRKLKDPEKLRKKQSAEFEELYKAAERLRRIHNSLLQMLRLEAQVDRYLI